MEDADICDFATAIVEFDGESGYAIVSIDADAATTTPTRRLTGTTDGSGSTATHTRHRAPTPADHSPGFVATFDVTVRLRLVWHPTGKPIPRQLLACATRLRYDET